jgi:hypothetical protein
MPSSPAPQPSPLRWGGMLGLPLASQNSACHPSSERVDGAEGARGVFQRLACATRERDASRSIHMSGWPQFPLEHAAGRIPLRTGPASMNGGDI